MVAPQKNSESSPPQSIGPYRVVERLGSGGMGEVYRGYDHRLDRPVALKHIRSAEGPGFKRARERFRREAQAVARLSHPAIVQVYDWIETDEGIWLVMELVQGDSVRDLLTDGPLDIQRTVKIARMVLRGLAAAHSAGIVHRDLKPDNVMVADENHIKILDFGLAKRLRTSFGETSLTAEGSVLGTVTAMSPEQATGHPVDHRSDLFSLGIMLYEMVTGVLPFKADNTVQTLIRICSRKHKPVAELNSKVPPVLVELIDRLLEKDPDRRLQSAAEVLEALDPVDGKKRKKRSRRTGPIGQSVRTKPSGDGEESAPEVLRGSDLPPRVPTSVANETVTESQTQTQILVPKGPFKVIYRRGLGGGSTEIPDADPSRSLLDLVLGAGIDHYHECGGRARCSTCRVRVVSGLENLRPRNPKEQEFAQRLGWDDDIRLACQARSVGEVVIQPLVQDALDLGMLLDEQSQARPAKETTLALLSCRLADFDEFARRVNPHVQVHLLYRFFGQIGTRIPANGGKIESYSRAGFRALFGLETGSAREKCIAAVRASLRSVARMRVFNRYARTYCSQELKLSIGLHFARVVVGRFGSTGKEQLFLVGESGPVVDAICDRNLEAGTRILASESFFNIIEEEVEIGNILPEQSVGRTSPEDLYELLDLRNPDAYFIVQRTFERLEANKEEAGALFYQILFDLAPNVKPLFAKTDMRHQEQMFVSMLTAAIKGLDRPGEVSSALRELGERHTAYGVLREHYEPLGRALLATVERMHGAELDLDVHLAWEHFFHRMVGMMTGER